MPSIVEKLKQAADIDQFLSIADGALLRLSSPEKLAVCAKYVADREPGGWYYQSKFWARVSEEVHFRANGDGQAVLKKLLRDFDMSFAELRLWEMRDNILRQVETELPGDQKIMLRKLDAKIFEFAVKQKNKKVEYIKHSLVCLSDAPRLSARQVNNAWCRTHGNLKSNLDIIKPSDWWAFGNPAWDSKMPGSIPGDVYANALYYYAPRKGVAVDAMAGGGTLKRVYDEREKWEKDAGFDLDVRMFDLYPGRPEIKMHDARNALPVAADWIFIDPPYFRQGGKFYRGLLAELRSYEKYLAEMEKVVVAMARSLNARGKLCIFCPKHRVVGADKPNIDVPSDLSACAKRAGLRWYDAVYVSRGRQQLADAPRRNIEAKRSRRTISDVCVLNVFEKGAK